MSPTAPRPVACRPASRPGFVVAAVMVAVAAGAAPLAAQLAPDREPAAAAPAGPAADRLCAHGRISRIEVDNLPVLPAEDAPAGPVRWGFGLANRLHVRTRSGLIRGELLFQEGDCFDPFLAAESQRLLERFGFISSARVAAEDDGDGGTRVRVVTRDEWTTRVDLVATYDDGLNLETFRFAEKNFLGRGLSADFARQERLERRLRSFGVSSPSLFGRASVGARVGSTPDGRSFGLAAARPFVGDIGRLSVGGSWARGTNLFALSAGEAEAYTHVLTPVREDRVQLSAAARIGAPGAGVILGASLTHDAFRPRGAQVSFGDFYDRSTAPGPLPAAVARQTPSVAATRVLVHAAVRRYRYATYRGLDAVRDEQTVGLGYLVGGTVGRSVPLVTREGAARLDDVIGRLHASGGAALGPLLLHAGTTAEARREAGAWRDVLADADLVLYAAGGALPGQTVLLRASAAGGWRTTLPFQLTLGGREGVRALEDRAFPGGRQLLFVAEDRIRFGWVPFGALDVGATVFGDLGRVWPGDVPFGVDSGWRAAAGFGLRLAAPSGSRNIWRPDVVFPLGPGGGGPLFRVTFEVHRLRSGFFNADLARSRRVGVGPERF